jgi:hypothetical protein
VISARAVDSLDRLFRDAARTRLVARDGDPCGVDALTARDAAPAGDDVVVLTISSIGFRLLLALQFADDAPTRGYYVDRADRTLRETFMEVANLCCGAINQALVTCFPDLGMSTPYLLNRRSIRHFDELRPVHLAAYTVTPGPGVRLGATLCVCAHAPLDFHVEPAEAASGGGELELF